MLICPQCQHENLDEQQLCQNCGTSLTHKVCHECKTEVPWEAERCHNCGAYTGTVWQASIAPPPEMLVDRWQGASADEAIYLDESQRYRILKLTPGISLDGQTPVLQARVLDTRPLQKTALDDLLEAQESGDREPEAWLTAYLELSAAFDPAVPLLRNAWRSSREQVVLLEDRSEWQLLADVWKAEPPPTMQALWWLAGTVKLWEPMQQMGCARSLLEVSNLRVDEDLTLALGQLYFDPVGSPPQLSQLGKVWQHLFAQQDAPPEGSLAKLLTALEAGEFGYAEQLNRALETIAFEQEGFGGEPEEMAAPLEAAPSESSNRAPKEKEDEDLPTVVLPMQLSNIDPLGRTDVGRQRKHNEDYFALQTWIEKHGTPFEETSLGKGLYIVCDGMGGHAAGEVASSMASEQLQKYLLEHWGDELPDEQTIRQAILSANDAIYQVNQEKASSGLGRMGTTLVLAMVHNTQVAIAHVGDSRVYQITRKRGLEQITLDHEVGQRQIQRGVDPQIAYSHPNAHQLTQALGPRSSSLVHPDIQFIEVNEDLLLLLCSDGLSDKNFLEKHADTYLVPLISSKANLEQGMNELIAAANKHNGHDNITGLLVRLKVRPMIQ